MTGRISLARAAAAAVAGLIVSLAPAGRAAATTTTVPGIVATYQASRNVTLTVEAALDGRGRLQERRGTEPPTSYTLVIRDRRNIQVRRRGSGATRSGGDGWLVMDARDYADYLRRDAPAPVRSDEPRGLFRQAGDERVGSWTGTRYVLPDEPWRWAEITELVVLRRADVAPLGRLLRANSLYGWHGTRPAPYLLQMADLMAQGAPLRVGDRLTLISLEFRPIERSRLEPPAPPLARAELFRLLDSNRPDPRIPPVACGTDCGPP